MDQILAMHTIKNKEIITSFLIRLQDCRSQTLSADGDASRLCVITTELRVQFIRDFKLNLFIIPHITTSPYGRPLFPRGFPRERHHNLSCILSLPHPSYFSRHVDGLSSWSASYATLACNAVSTPGLFGSTIHRSYDKHGLPTGTSACLWLF